MGSVFDPSGQHNNVDARIVATLERLSQVFRVRLREEARQRNLSPIQAQLLIYLLHHDVELRRVSQLAREFDLTQAHGQRRRRIPQNQGIRPAGTMAREPARRDPAFDRRRREARDHPIELGGSHKRASGAFHSCGERGRNALPDGTHGFIPEIRPHNRRQDVCDLQILPAGRPSRGGVAAPLWAPGRATRRPQSPR